MGLNSPVRAERETAKTPAPTGDWRSRAVYLLLRIRKQRNPIAGLIILKIAVRKSASEMTGLGFGGYHDRLSIMGCRDKTKLVVKDKT